MVLGGFFLTVNDALQKSMTADFPRGEILTVRGLFVMAPVLFIAWRMGGLSTLKIHSFRSQGARSALVCVAAFLFVSALSLMPLADAIALTFVGPLLMTALAAFLLKEVIGWRRWAAVLVGLIGVMIMLRPGSGAMQWIALLPLGVAFCGALGDVITRRMHDTESTPAIMFYSNLGIVLVYSTTIVEGWKPIDATHLVLFALNGLALGLAYFLLIEALRLAKASVVAPYKYVSVLWAVALGYVIWGDIPDAWMLSGGGLVIACGMYTLHRESLAKGEA